MVFNGLFYQLNHAQVKTVERRLRVLGLGLMFGLFSSSSSWGVDVDFQAPPDETDSLAVAYDCLASLARYSRGKKELLSRAVSDGKRLMASAVADQSGRTGWPYIQRATEESKKCGLAGSLDAFSDGSCNPANTPYMLQTGYGLTCLAQLSIATGESTYLEFARKVARDSWNLGTAAPAGCRDCYYYWYSYHANDVGRFVRNTNLAMGLGVAWLYAATGEVVYRDRALAVARAEHQEIAMGNWGYFGSSDPKFKNDPRSEAQRIENHAPHQVKALKDIGLLFSSEQAIADARAVLDSFVNCRNERCRLDNCKAWAAPPSCKATATIAPCILADYGEPYSSQCQAVLKELPKLNAFQAFALEATSDRRKLERR